MIRSTLGALLGALTIAVLVSAARLLLGWLGFDGTLLLAGGLGALAGAALGWLRPRIFLAPMRVFLEPNLFD